MRQKLFWTLVAITLNLTSCRTNKVNEKITYFHHIQDQRGNVNLFAGNCQGLLRVLDFTWMKHIHSNCYHFHPIISTYFSSEKYGDCIIGRSMNILEDLLGVPTKKTETAIFYLLDLECRKLTQTSNSLTSSYLVFEISNEVISKVYTTGVKKSYND